MCNDKCDQSGTMYSAAHALALGGFRAGVSRTWLTARRELAAELSIRIAYANVRRVIETAAGIDGNEAVEEVFDQIGADAMRLGSSDFSWGMHFPPAYFKDCRFLLAAWKMGYSVAAADENIARLEAGTFADAGLELAVGELERIFASTIKR